MQKTGYLRPSPKQAESVVPAILAHLLETDDFPYRHFISETLEGWEPTPAVLNYFMQVLRHLSPVAMWAVPGTGQIYEINKPERTITLVHGDANDPNQWHEKTKMVFQALGYTMHEPAPPENPDEQTFTEARVRKPKVALPTDPHQRTAQDAGGTLIYAPLNREKLNREYRIPMLKSLQKLLTASAAPAML